MRGRDGTRDRPLANSNSARRRRARSRPPDRENHPPFSFSDGSRRMGYPSVEPPAGGFRVGRAAADPRGRGTTAESNTGAGSVVAPACVSIERDCASDGRPSTARGHPGGRVANRPASPHLAGPKRHGSVANITSEMRSGQVSRFLNPRFSAPMPRGIGGRIRGEGDPSRGTPDVGPPGRSMTSASRRGGPPSSDGGTHRSSPTPGGAAPAFRAWRSPFPHLARYEHWIDSVSVLRHPGGGHRFSGAARPGPRPDAGRGPPGRGPRSSSASGRGTGCRR